LSSAIPSGNILATPRPHGIDPCGWSGGNSDNTNVYTHLHVTSDTPAVAYGRTGDISREEETP
jgi:hypothetical protein